MSKNKKLIIIAISILLVIMVVCGVLLFSKEQSTFYELKFDSNGGTLVEKKTIKSGEKIKVPENPTREGYEFIEWQYQGESFDFNKAIDKDVVLTAKWEKIEEVQEQFIVKFDSDGGTSIPDQNVEKDQLVIKPADPSKDGYTFVNWQLDSKEFNFETKVTSNITLIAKWEKNSNKVQTTVKPNTNSGSASSQKPTETPKPVVKNYTVTFNSNGGSSVSNQVISSGNKASKPSNPTKTGYNFSGWSLNGKSFNFSTAITSNITLVANWTRKNYTITVSKVDAYSPDRKLTVKEDGKTISVSAIKYSDRYPLCSGSNMTVSESDISGETSLIVVLSDGTEVTATIN